MPNLGAGQPFSSERLCMSDAKAAAEVEGDSFADVEASRLYGSLIMRAERSPRRPEWGMRSPATIPRPPSARARHKARDDVD